MGSTNWSKPVIKSGKEDRLSGGIKNGRIREEYKKEKKS